MAAKADVVTLAGNTYVLVNAGDSKDVKDTKAPADTKLTLPSAQALRVRSLLSSKSMKPIRTRIPFNWSASAVAGVVNGTQTVTPDANGTEWGAFAVLYDEYRVLGGVVKYSIAGNSQIYSSTGLTNPDYAFCVLAYDPVSGTSALSGVRNGCEYSQHDLRSSSFAAEVTSGSAYQAFRRDNGEPYSFRFKVPNGKALVQSTSSGVTAAPGSWKSVQAATNNTPDGTLKVFTTLNTSYAGVAFNAVVFVDVEFRCRR
jgi:hypothetical protein